MKAVIATLYLCITSCSIAMAQPRGWRGLVPLHSTRADVESLLGQPNEMLSKYSGFYRTANETVIIKYATGFPCGIGEKYSQWRVARDTLESILVTPLLGFPVSELRLDENKLEKRNGGHRPEDVYYIDDQGGESIRVFRGEVMNISFYPGRVDADLSCPELPRVSSKPCKGLSPPASDGCAPIPSPTIDQRDVQIIAQTKRVGWHGIVPLRSTRADVIRLLGPPNVEGRYYEIENHTVHIDYSDGPCAKGKSGWNVPRDTVVSISLAPIKDLKLSDLRIDRKKYKKSKDGELPGIVYYTNDAEGITISVSKGEVRNIYYNPTSKDDYLRCPS